MQEFGGDWTQEKLVRLEKYLQAYTQILSKRNYRFAYIDAFAGTGYREIREVGTEEPLFPNLADEEPERFLDGFVRIALRVEPRFNKYIFVEMNSSGSGTFNREH